MIKESIESSKEHISKQFNSQINAVYAEVNDCYKKIKALDIRLSDLNGASQRQQEMIEQVEISQKHVERSQKK